MTRPFYVQVLEAELKNPGYKANDPHTYTQEIISDRLLTDIAIHMFGDHNERAVSYQDKHGQPTRGAYHAGHMERVENAVLKFSKPQGMTHVFSKKMNSVLPPFIVERYKLYTSQKFNARSLIHLQQVKVFYCHRTKKFAVTLPDHFSEGITSDKIAGPDRYKRGMFLYDTQAELEAKYPLDLLVFVNNYLSFFAHHQEGKPVILVHSSRANGHSDYHDKRSLKQSDEYYTTSFSNGLMMTRGVLYGEIFYQLRTDGNMDVEHGMRLAAFHDQAIHRLSGSPETPKVIRHCIPYTEEDWKALVAIIEAFHKAQNALDALLDKSHNPSAVLGQGLDTRMLESAIAERFRLSW